MSTVLIAGIAGGSLGTEIAKSLNHAGRHRVLGCDISPLAFGHYAGVCEQTFVLSLATYIDDILAICEANGVEVVIPGGNSPAVLIGGAEARFAERGILVAGNTAEVVEMAADKARCFEALDELGVQTPDTFRVTADTDFKDLPYPCVIKPSTESGGSSFVFFARNAAEAALYAAYLSNNGMASVAQEYISHADGEFTVGVLSDAEGNVDGVIALKRSFPAKLSVMASGADFLISSGISQGHIGPYPEVCETAVQIAKKFGSKGPLNIQGRIKNGVFVPFEINPRFSASTYLRTLAGFNEVDHFIAKRRGLALAAPLESRPGWYLRGLAEVVAPDGALKA